MMMVLNRKSLTKEELNQCLGGAGLVVEDAVELIEAARKLGSSPGQKLHWRDQFRQLCDYKGLVTVMYQRGLLTSSGSGFRLSVSNTDCFIKEN